VKIEFLTYDRELALTQVGGNPNTADELLEMMLRELPDQCLAMSKAVDAGQMDQLRAIVHRIRGAASCCGTPGVAETSSALEFAIKLGADNDVSDLLEVLLGEIESLINDQWSP
jgi:HPt (histidine-containing phosphotransfer) domain-containing protein